MVKGDHPNMAVVGRAGTTELQEEEHMDFNKKIQPFSGERGLPVTI